jgi:hypothetical protein
MSDGAVREPSRTGGSLRRFFELAVLCSFAIAQPLLDVTGRSPETFIFYRVDGVEVIVFALLILVVPPVALWLVIAAISLLSRPAGRIGYAVVAGALIGLIAVQVGKRVPDLRGPLLVVLAALLAGAALWLSARFAAARTFVTYLTPAPLIFALIFLLSSPTSALVHGSSAADQEPGTADGHGPSPPIVMLLLDELPLMALLDSHGQVDERVYPNFARLAATSHWFRNATGVGPYTQYAVPAMLAGRYPETKVPPSYLEHPDSLFSMLAPDYRIRAFETITQLCDPAICAGTAAGGGEGGLRGLFGQTWQVAKAIAKPYDGSGPISDQFAEEPVGPVNQSVADTSHPNWKALKANQPRRFQRFLAGLRPPDTSRSDKPTLNFLHLLLPHHPWHYLPSGTTYPDKILGGINRGWDKYRWPLQVNRQAMILQLAYTDRLLGEVIDRMQQRGIWDRSLVVVTADHGERFLPGGSGRHLARRPQSEAQLAWVPMFIKEPGQSTGTVSDANWEHADLLPTIADVLDRPVPFRVEGISQLSETRERTEKYFYNVPGKRITFPEQPAFRIVLNGLTDSFVHASLGVDGLFVMGSHPDWIGKPVSSLTSLGVDVDGPPSPMSAHLADELDFDDVDPSSGLVPSLVRGTVQRSPGRGPVLIAVNGTVAAVSQIYPQDGTPSFAGFANDKLFHPGANDVRLYEIAGGAAAPELLPIKTR